MKAIIDIGTILVHSALAGQETKTIVVHKKSGREKEFDNVTQFWGHHKKKAGGWLAATNDARIEKGLEPFVPDDFEIQQFTNLIEGNPEAIACGRLKNKIEAITSNDWCDDFIICLGVGDNFRYAEAHTQPYKDGRPSKPLLLEYVRDYLQKKYWRNLYICKDTEDDDGITSILWDDWKKCGGSLTNNKHSDNSLSTVAVAIDKDILQSPGWHFNFDKPEDGLRYVTIEEAHKNFAMQLLIGDNTDNIPSLPELHNDLCAKWNIRKTKGLGNKTAEAILDGQSTQGMYERVLEAYRAFYGIEKQPFESFRGDVLYWNYLDHLNERFQLLRLREDVNTPVGYVSEFLNKLGVDCE